MILSMKARRCGPPVPRESIQRSPRITNGGRLGIAVIGGLFFVAGLGAAPLAPATQPANLPPMGNVTGVRAEVDAGSRTLPSLAAARAGAPRAAGREIRWTASTATAAGGRPSSAGGFAGGPAFGGAVGSRPANHVCHDRSERPAGRDHRGQSRRGHTRSGNRSDARSCPARRIGCPLRPAEKSSPPALLLPIPDPSPQPGASPATQPAREDGPVTNFERPGPTTLPAGK